MLKRNTLVVLGDQVNHFKGIYTQFVPRFHSDRSRNAFSYYLNLYSCP